jgi:hypothetical protein
MQPTPPPGFALEGSSSPETSGKTVTRQEVEELAEELRIPYASAERQFIDAGYEVS